MSEICGPYVDGAFHNKPGETVFYCVSCANERDIPETNAIMYDKLSDMNVIECAGCDGRLRD